MNKKTSILTFILALTGVLLYQADDPRRVCADLRDAPGEPGALGSLQSSAGNTVVARPAPVSAAKPVYTQGPKVAPVFAADVPANIKTQMLQDLGFVGTITSQKTSALHSGIFGRVNGADYTTFFNDRVKSVGMNGCGSALAVACVIPFQSNTKMWLTQNYIKFSHPQIARVMIVFHESRHTESKNHNWHHADCPDPFQDANGNDVHSIWTGASLVGESGACDITPYGSYGSSLIMLKNIQRYCTNCTEKVMMDAGMYADDQLNRIVDAKAKAAIKADIYK
ncbi:MAG TPA: hypothetical protein PKI19_05010 [Elusimicrobiales bacterium]|nr:hypothetical protein [Elusimicrobiales bacterium]